MGQIAAASGAGLATWVYILIGVPSTILGILGIADRYERHRERKSREADQDLTNKVNAALKVLTGTHNLADIRDPSPENPSIRDQLDQALEETAAITAAVAMLRDALERHASDRHGEPIPEWIWRASRVRENGG